MALEFSDWYRKRHPYAPFPWQERLAELVAAGTPPGTISVPTGTGKTTIIAVWQWAKEVGISGVPTRLIYVVDRRLIVDSVTDYADCLGCQVIKMRGGITIDDSWLMSPTQPTIIVSTVDQVGSRLLWRGYGVSPKQAPIHAALVGNDALLVLDEAHISTPFASTLEAVSRLRGASALPWQVTLMTATPVKAGDCLGLSQADRDHPVLRQRLQSSKLARLVKVEKDTFVATLVAETLALRAAGARVVGVICNTTRHARDVFNQLPDEKILLTGRIRPADKDAILTTYLPNILSGSRDRRGPLFVVATQTIEVGADLDFDALVTQSAPLGALRQRFGRVDRLGQLGKSESVIVHQNLGADDECPIYGKKLLKDTWNWLTKAGRGSGKHTRLDFGIDAMDGSCERSPPPVRDTTPVRDFTATDLRKLRQTLPPVPVDVTPWLHGDQTDAASVSLVWRSDLAEDDTASWPAIMEASPAVLAEMMPSPLYEVRQWLGSRPVLASKGVVSGTDIRPGDLVAVPCRYGGYGPWGWEPESSAPVADIGNQVGARVRLIGADEGTDINARLAELGVDIPNPVASPYPAGLIVTAANRRVKSRAIRLDDHLRDIAAVAQTLSDDPRVVQAAALHDIGKGDPRFQVLLGARDQPLAKSAHPSPWAARQAREWSGLPPGWRHEIASLAHLQDDVADLVRYLVATHHGHGRTILPVSGDETLWHRAGGPTWGKITERLNQEHGAWGLAYKEALVRLADWIQSEKEQQACSK